MNFPCLWAPYIPTLCIIFGIAQYLLHNNLSIIIRLLTAHLSQGRHMGHAAGQGTFFHFTHPCPRRDCLLEDGPRQCILKHFEKPKFKILSFLAFQVSSGVYPVHLQGQYPQVVITYF